MAVKDTTTPVTINFHFDPQCPLAWRTALWVRETRNTRPVTIQWRLFSLEVVNRKEGVEPDYVNGSGWAALRTLALARRQKGNEAIEKLYVALGNAAHGRKESIRQREGVEKVAQEAGFGAGFVEAALNDESTIQDVLNDHEEAVKRYLCFWRTNHCIRRLQRRLLWPDHQHRSPGRRGCRSLGLHTLGTTATKYIRAKA